MAPRTRQQAARAAPPPLPPDDSPTLVTASTFKVIADAIRAVATAKRIDSNYDAFELFKKMNPPVFTGDNEDDRETAFDWLSDLEKFFDEVQFDDDKKVRFGTYMLEGRAMRWWNGNEKLLSTPVDWKGFRELFEAEYCSRSYCGRKYIEFLDLKQRNLSVIDYAKRFNKLSRFASSLVADEYRKAMQFERGLRFNIRCAMQYCLLDTYRDVVETAMLVEREQSLSQFHQPKDQKRKDRPGGFQRNDGPAKKPYVPTSCLPLLDDDNSSSPSAAAKVIRGPASHLHESNPLRSSSPSSTKVVAAATCGVERERDSYNDREALECFLELNPPVFTGDCDPQEAFGWLSAIEKLFEVTQYRDKWKVRFGTFMLRGGANHWWTLKKEKLQAPVNWKAFCELFEADFFIQGYRDKKFAEFLDLKQGDLSVNEYDGRFLSLSRFALSMVADMYAMAKKFEMGLRPDIRSVVALFRHRNYDDVLNTARVIERNQSLRGSENDGQIW